MAEPVTLPRLLLRNARDFAAREAERSQAEGEVADVLVVLAPVPRLPDAAVLLADGRPAGVLDGVAQQVTRQGRRPSHDVAPWPAWPRRDRP